MNSATQDAVETLRQLQKLSRELQPVKTALAAIVKRERANPNPSAAANSLEKVALRVSEVSRKYSAFFDRMSFLLECELPQQQRMIPLLETINTDEDNNSNNINNSSNGIGIGVGGSSGPSNGCIKKNNSAINYFQYVCSPSIPHILEPENFRMVQERIHIQMEVVNYLIATERFQLARHVVESYGLPLFWFPRLVSLALPVLPPIQGSNHSGEEKGRNSESPASNFVSPYLAFAKPEEQCPSSSSSNIVAPEHIAIQCIEAKHSVTEAITYCEERLLPALEGIDIMRRPKINELLYDLLADLHATRLLQIFRDGRTEQQEIVHYIAAHILPHATRRPHFAQTVINAVTLQNEPYSREKSSEEQSTDNNNNNNNNNTNTNNIGQNSMTPKSKNATLQKKEEAMRLVASMMSVEGYHKLAVSFHRVAILVGSQILSVSEAIDRRHQFISDGEGGVTSSSCCDGDWPHTLPDLVARVVATSIFLKDDYFDRMVLERSNNTTTTNNNNNTIINTNNTNTTNTTNIPPIPISHLNTQSGSSTFDEAVMTVLEEALSALTDTRQRGESGRSAAPLSAEDLLIAGERWSNDVLFIKRPTRFYCYLTKECMDGGRSDNYPVVLPNGTVLSKFAVSQCLVQKGEGDNQTLMVVCPRTKEEYAVSQVKRIFVT